MDTGSTKEHKWLSAIFPGTAFGEFGCSPGGVINDCSKFLKKIVGMGKGVCKQQREISISARVEELRVNEVCFDGGRFAADSSSADLELFKQRFSSPASKR